VDPFAVVIFGGLAALVIFILLLGRFYPGSGADVLDWKPTRSIEVEAELELQDIDQMLEAQNERRRARGEPELTEDQIRAEVAAHEEAQAELRAQLDRERGRDA
jgi:C4-dicarboxylate-specific signal transduction histidine kinase